MPTKMGSDNKIRHVFLEGQAPPYPKVGTPHPQLFGTFYLHPLFMTCSKQILPSDWTYSLREENVCRVDHASGEGHKFFSDMLMCDVFAVANLKSNDLQVMSLPVHALHRADASFHALVICFYKFL